MWKIVPEKMNRQRAWGLIRDLPRLLDWLLAVAERLFVLCVLSGIFYLGFRAIRGTISQEQKKLLPILADNWKIAILLLIPLFYQTVRIFLEEVQEFWGMKRKPQKGREIDQDEENLPERVKKTK